MIHSETAYPVIVFVRESVGMWRRWRHVVLVVVQLGVMCVHMLKNCHGYHWDSTLLLFGQTNQAL